MDGDSEVGLRALNALVRNYVTVLGTHTLMGRGLAATFRCTDLEGHAAPIALGHRPGDGELAMPVSTPNPSATEPPPCSPAAMVTR